MMTMTRPTFRRSLTTPLALGLALAACGREGEPSPDAISVQVAPLTLPGLGNACYTLTTTNDLDEVVWTRSGICADDFGDSRSAITYVGPCDATDNDTADGGPAQNTVELVLEGLWDANGALIDEGTYQNPCGSEGPTADPADDVNYDGFGPCSLTVSCRENADVPVAFDITVMRDAGQGFFDVAVNFDDIFCSAKLDCLQDLLHNPATGERDDTIVAGFACTSGQGTPTWLYLNAARIVCDDDNDPATAPDYVYYIDQAADADGEGGLRPGKGNLGPVFPIPMPSPAPDPNLIYQVGSYRGLELFTEVDKCYWNLAVGLEVEAFSAAPLGGPTVANPQTCWFELEGTAGDALWTDDPARPGSQDNLTPRGWYPYFRWRVQLNDPQTGAMICTSHPVNGTPAGVETIYTDASGARFDWAMSCQDEDLTCPGQFTCEGTLPGVTGEIVVEELPATGGVTVTVGTAQSAGPYVLPTGLQISRQAGGCCVNPCCDQTPAAP